MSQAPAMPLFWGDYWSKTRRLSPAQHHAYLFLLGATWMNNCRPFQDDDETIAGEIGISVSAWRKVRPMIVRFFDLSDGTWRSRKLEEVWADVMRRVEKNRENGRLGGRPPKHNQTGKAQENQSSGKPNGSVSVNPNESIQNQSQIEEGSEGIEPSAADAAPARLKPDATTVVAFQPKPVPPDPKKELYDLGREALGAGYGGQVTKLIRHHDGDIQAALYTMGQVARATNPAEYLGRILSGEASAPFDTAAFYRAHGIRPDGTSVGDDTWLPLTQRPGTDENGNPCDQWGNPWVGPVKASR